MPTYEYLCKQCDKRFDVVQSFKDDALTECLCPEKGQVRKVYGAVGIAFKGSGFYKTDARSSGGGSKGGAAAASSAGEGSPAPAGGDAGSSAPAKADGGSSTPSTPATPAASTTA